jgi:hypothetical protein
MVLVDGRVVGSWFSKREKDVATATVTLVTSMGRKATAAVESEADAVLGFLHPGTHERRVTVGPPR